MDDTGLPGGASGPSSGPNGARTLHVHPTTLCNLSCLHCYSWSSPAATATLPFARIVEAIDDAARLGYRVLSVSGGEPFVYGQLEAMLAVAKSHGMTTTVVTNGMNLDRPRSLAALELCDIVAVSVDGWEENHNRMRGSARAWSAAMAGLAQLRDRARPFGLITTATRTSWWEVEQLADLAVRHGASLLQIHPLQPTGRAGEQAADLFMTEEDTLRLFILAGILSTQHAGKLQVQLDLVHRDWVRAQPERFYAADETTQDLAAPPSVLVLQTDGLVVPISHGLGARFGVTNVHERRLMDAWGDFLTGTYPRLRSACRAIAAEIVADGATPHVFNWHDLVIQRSLEGAAPATVPG